MKLPVGGVGLGGGGGGGGGGDVVVEAGSVVGVTSTVDGTDVVVCPPLCPRFAVATAFVNVLDEVRDVVDVVAAVVDADVAARSWAPSACACPDPPDRLIANRATTIAATKTVNRPCNTPLRRLRRRMASPFRPLRA